MVDLETSLRFGFECKLGLGLVLRFEFELFLGLVLELVYS